MPSKKSIHCIKCKKIFSSEYLLQKHINKKVPCDQILQCMKCKKIFNQHHHLEQHLNRKTSCVKISSIEKEIMIINAKKEAEIEIINAKKEAKLEIEKEKTKQKNNKTIINNTTNNIINTTINVVNYNEETLKKMIENLDLWEYICCIKNVIENGNTKNLIQKIISQTHNNNNYPEYKNIIHNNNNFYTIKDNNWIEKEFKDISPNLHNTIYKILSSTKKYVQKNKEKIDLPPKIKLSLDLLLCGYNNINTIKELKTYAENALSEEETIPNEDEMLDLELLNT